jgi:ribosome-associated toxin RatA of RatAB toxin-antitoxin module
MTLAGVDAASVYNLLTDYEASPRAFRAVKSAKVIECTGDSCVASNIYIEQECLWNFFVFGGAFPCAFEVEERDEEMRMKCSLAPGLGRGSGFLRRFEGSWAVEALDDGQVKVEHVLMVQPKLTPPYASKIFVQQVEQILADVVQEIERWDAPYPKPPHRAP